MMLNNVEMEKGVKIKPVRNVSKAFFDLSCLTPVHVIEELFYKLQYTFN
jgi:hypothetical protein